MSGYSSKRPALFDDSRPAAERYRIIGRIASGGMAEIYLARMLTSAGVEREVVLKRLMPELQTDHEFVQMFYDEARIASQMRHPNIVQIYELGELDGSLFISMELLRGVNLRDMLARLHHRGENLPLPLAVRVACGALEALSYAHRFTDQNGRLLNVVHRDVSPQNIIVTYEGTVKLVDFGVAKAEGRLHQTRAGLIKGKFAYMSPEQISGGKVDGRSDLFALAEVFYELLLRRHPFYAASDMEVLRAILDSDPPHPTAIDQSFPAELGAVLMRAMRKNPGDRYPNATAMHDALELFLQEQRTPATTIMLGRFVRELFIDRVDMEQRAREANDDDLLIESMTSGKNEVSAPHQPSARRRPSRGGRIADASEREATDRKMLPASTSGVRNQVVEISHSGGADPSAPVFLAHSGYTDPGLRRRRIQSQIQSQVRKLFDDPAETSSPNTHSLEHAESEGPTSRHFPTSEDSGELPTMLGTLSADQLAEIRGEPRRQNVIVEKPTGRPSREDSVAVVPAKTSGAPVIKRSPPTPGGIPATRTGANSTAARQQAVNVTPRSRTVLQPEDMVAPRSDRWGLLLFVAGLGALVGAIVYAFVLYTGAQNPIMRLVVSSTPTGAAIVFDGRDTGVVTPQIFNNIPSNKEHALELRLEGYEPYVRKLPPSPELGELIIDWRFREVPKATPAPEEEKSGDGTGGGDGAGAPQSAP